MRTAINMDARPWPRFAQTPIRENVGSCSSAKQPAGPQTSGRIGRAVMRAQTTALGFSRPVGTARPR
jgi:hypothetical protein